MADAARQSCVAAMLALSQLGQPPDTSHRRNKDLPQRSSTVTEPADTNAGCEHVQPPCINPDVIQPPPQQARTLEHTNRQRLDAHTHPGPGSRRHTHCSTQATTLAQTTLCLKLYAIRNGNKPEPIVQIQRVPGACRWFRVEPGVLLRLTTAGTSRRSVSAWA